MVDPVVGVLLMILLAPGVCWLSVRSPPDPPTPSFSLKDQAASGGKSIGRSNLQADELVHYKTPGSLR